METPLFSYQEPEHHRATAVPCLIDRPNNGFRRATTLAHRSPQSVLEPLSWARPVCCTDGGVQPIGSLSPISSLATQPLRCSMECSTSMTMASPPAPV